jgi:hypothetical protein
MRICVDVRTGLQVSCVVCPNADRCPRCEFNQKKVSNKNSKKGEA